MGRVNIELFWARLAACRIPHAASRTPHPACRMPRGPRPGFSPSRPLTVNRGPAGGVVLRPLSFPAEAVTCPANHSSFIIHHLSAIIQMIPPDNTNTAITLTVSVASPARPGSARQRQAIPGYYPG
jgi:hypothetical protein